MVARLVTPDTERSPPIDKLPNDVALLNCKDCETLRLPIVEEEIVVVAKFVTPRTTNGPVEVDPFELDKKLRFSTQAEPFQ